MKVEQKGYYDFIRNWQEQLETGFSQAKGQDVLSRHREAMDKEYRAGGHKPVVCVVGKKDYDELLGTLSLLYGMPIIHEKSAEKRLREFMGMVMVPSYSIEAGFYFGSEDEFAREQQETKASKEKELAEKIADADFAAFVNRQDRIVAIQKILDEYKNGPD